MVPVLFTFYIQGVLKLKKNNSGAKMLITCASPAKSRQYFYRNVHCTLAGHTSQRSVTVASHLCSNYDAVIVQRLARFVTAVARTLYTALPSRDFTPCICNKMSFYMQLTAVKFHGMACNCADDCVCCFENVYTDMKWLL